MKGVARDNLTATEINDKEMWKNFFLEVFSLQRIELNSFNIFMSEM